MATRSPSGATVDVVVVTYNPGTTLATFLDSLRIAGGTVTSVTVVDSASPDRSGLVAAERAGVTVISMPSNRGYGAAANAGASGGSGTWVAVCNADLVWHRDALAALVAEGESDPRIGSTGPLIRERDGSTYPSARPLPSLALGIGHALFSKAWPSNPWSARYRPTVDPLSGPADVGWLSGSCLLVRRAAFEQVEGFDEGFFMFMEDVDLGRRLGLAGWLNRWVPAATVIHIGGHSWRRDPAPMIRAHHRSAIRYNNMVHPRWFHAPVRWVVSAGLRLRSAMQVAAARRAKAD